MFGTDLGDEYRSIASTFGLGIGDLAELVANGVRSAFLPDTAKTPLLAEIATIAEAAPPPDRRRVVQGRRQVQSSPSPLVMRVPGITRSQEGRSSRTPNAGDAGESQSG